MLLKDASLMLKQPNSTHNHVVIENTFFLSWKKFEIKLHTTCYHCTKSITMLDRNKIVTSLVQFWHLIISFVCLWKSGLFFLVIKMEKWFQSKKITSFCITYLSITDNVTYNISHRNHYYYDWNNKNKSSKNNNR